MKNKSQIRIIGEVITLISNIFITLSIIGGAIYLYVVKSISQGLINNVIGVEFYEYDASSNIIGKILEYIDSNMILIASLVITTITLIWVLRAIFIRSTSIATSVVAIVLNITNLLSLIGYALILYDNIQIKNNPVDVEKDLEITSKSSNGTIILVIATLVILMSIFIIFMFVKTYDKQINNNELDTKQSQITQSTQNEQDENYIRSDYDNKSIQAQDVLTKERGFQRYYVILIDCLRGYDISNLENAKVVYELSDKLLNNMYQEFKNNMSAESFNELRDEQRNWVKDKEVSENNMKNDELLKYQTLIKITLDRCEEWTNYYN